MTVVSAVCEVMTAGNVRVGGVVGAATAAAKRLCLVTSMPSRAGKRGLILIVDSFRPYCNQATRNQRAKVSDANPSQPRLKRGGDGTLKPASKKRTNASTKKIKFMFAAMSFALAVSFYRL